MSAALRLAFAGTPDFAVPALQSLARPGSGRYKLTAVYTQPDRPAGRGRQVGASAVKQAAQQLGLTVLQPASFKDPQALQELASLDLDLLIVAAYGLILPQAILDIPRLGCINIHASLLPRWRGAAPIQRAILAGDTQSGISIMRMEAGLDTGPVLLERAIELSAQETAGELESRLAALGAQCVVEAVDAFSRGSVQARPQDDAGASYARKIDKSEARIDWTQRALQIERTVRAFNPRPVAETRWRAQQLRIWRAQAVDVPSEGAHGAAQPGAVLAATPQALMIQCGEGALAIHQLQLPGKQPIAVRDFLAAHDPRGAVLGVA